MSKDIRIQLALDNWESYVIQLASMPDEKLSQKLDIINMQAKIAYEKKIESSSELLEIWWRQVVEARIYKAEHNIPDAPDEIEEAIAHIETIIVKAEERQEAFTEDTTPYKIHRPKIKEEDKDQMSLF